MQYDERRREYVSGLRRGLKAVVRGMGEIDPLKRRVLILDGAMRVLQAHERYTGATVGTAEVWKPLILEAADNTGPDGFLMALVVAIEGQYHIQPSTQDWRAAR